MPTSTTTPASEQDHAVRLAIYQAFVREARAPRRAEVAARTGLSRADVDASYERLAAAHALVLDRTGEVWMAMPFSAVPTDLVVTDGTHLWWANCAWDALGIAAATHRPVAITAHCPDCNEPLILRVDGTGATSSPAGVVALFGVPASEWWDDIGFT